MIFQFGAISDPFGPSGLNVTGLAGTASGSGLVIILNNLIKFVIVVACLYTFWNLILAGYGFMSAGGEAKAIEKAWAKIWQSLMGLLVVAGSFVLAMIFGWLIFQDATVLIAPKIYTP